MLHAFLQPRPLGTADMLDSWSGIGHVAVGIGRQGDDLQPTRYDEKRWDEKRWRATFYLTGI